MPFTDFRKYFFLTATTFNKILSRCNLLSLYNLAIKQMSKTNKVLNLLNVFPLFRISIVFYKKNISLIPNLKIINLIYDYSRKSSRQTLFKMGRR